MKRFFFLLIYVFLSTSLEAQICGEVNDSVYLLIQDHKFSEALKVAESALECCSKGPSKSKYGLGIAYTNLGFIYWQGFNNYSSAVRFFKLSNSIFSELYLQDPSNKKLFKELCTSLDNLAGCYESAKDLSTADSLYVSELSLISDVLSEKSTEWVKVANKVGFVWMAQGWLKDARDLFQRCLSVSEYLIEMRASKENYIFNDITLHNLATSLGYLHSVDSAELIFKKVIAGRRTIYGPDDEMVALGLMDLGVFEMEHDRVVSALGHAQEAVEIIDKKPFLKKINYLTFLSNYGVILSNNDLLVEAFGIYTRALATASRPENDSSSIANFYTNYANLLLKLGRTTEALEFFYKANDYWANEKGGDYNRYAKSLCNTAAALDKLGDKETALPTYKSAIFIYRTMNRIDLEYAEALSGLSVILSELEKYDSSLLVLKEALKVKRGIYTEDNLSIATTLSNIAYVEEHLGNLDSAIAINKSTLLIEDGLKFNNRQTTITKANLARCYWKRGLLVPAKSLYVECIEARLKSLKESFTILSEREKQNYLAMSNHWDDIFKSFAYALNVRNIRDFNSYIYENELVRKDLLVTSQVRVLQSGLNSGDSSLSNAVVEYKKIRDEQNRITSIPGFKDDDYEVKLEANLKRLERIAASKSNDFKQQLDQLSVSWTEIRDVLRDGEAAIEFISYEYFDAGTWMNVKKYAALIVKKGLTAPIWIQLFDEPSLNKVLQTASMAISEEARISSLYPRSRSSATTIYDMAWKPLEAYLSGISRIYYSPTSKLYNISFNALLDDKQQYLVERYDLYLLNSTKELLTYEAKTLKFGNKLHAVLYGGIAYDFGRNVKDVGKKTLFTTKRVIEERWDYMPGSLTEVESLSKKIQASGSFVTLFSDSSATEESIKRLEISSATDILHIASHGFFIEKVEDNPNSFSRFLDPLQRCGLLFYGANYGWKTGKRLVDRDDGILTGNEVQNLNLFDTKLIVLSACQTADGDNIPYEGVYGIRRAIRMAGGENIVSTLWKIRDDITIVFMNEFYANLISGKTIHDSFNQAQLNLMRMPSYSPFHWAGFILTE